MRLKIVATPESREGKERLRWRVDVFSGGQLVRNSVALEDPLDDKDKELCRWYLEQYLQKEPYSASTAKKATSTLEGYGKSLAEQLQLPELVLQSDNEIQVEVEDATVDGTHPHDSVHQLFWEFLEDPSVWPSTVSAICVRRAIETAIQPLRFSQRISSWPCSGQARQRVNILLVTARDLRRDSSLYTDISPSIVIDLLSEIQHRLTLGGSAIDIAIEVVRPGTLDALKQHLADSKRIHGPGYYQVIHLDVHGKVGTHRGALRSSKYGVLYFSNPDSYSVKAIRASEVAKVVGQHSIPIVVLNACESARANAGDDANIAKTFAKSGSAMAKFLETFYREFLLEGQSFTISAMAARRVIRMEPNRDARFQMSTPLCDWFVPVVYSSAEEIHFIRPDSLNNLPADPSFQQPTHTDALPGRGFDLLRLEKALATGGVVYLTGPAGVGKTALLHYATSLWVKTSFVEVSVFLDFSRQNLLSMDAILDSIADQLSQSDITSDTIQFMSESTEEKSKRLLDLLHDSRVAFILDGLLDLRYKNDAEPRNQTAAPLLQFLQLARAQRHDLQEPDHIMIISGCVKNFPDNLALGRLPVYELKGLSISESVDIIHQINTVG
ncbi:hypothetical protein NA57DRAFT_76463 [Rhizodiscina lignyota]|uniref:CHAT domain-containing protein n=1 Tax=Rhizodiscina lignyota TaxID=1504668 RepID=A0A9P4IH76_9PEZI|nr:hypothetical protein NA57DRAFT_76463 [Rhizodiscina lignyota]